MLSSGPLGVLSATTSFIAASFETAAALVGA